MKKQTKYEKALDLTARRRAETAGAVEAELTRIEARIERYHDKQFEGRVIWFDKPSGEGVIELSDGSRWIAHACNIVGAKTGYNDTCCAYLNAGDAVTVTCYVLHNMSRIHHITGGHIDTEKWERIKDKNLAFRCDENGNFINGLFG